MEDIIRKIISIDQGARDIVRTHEDEIQDNEAAAQKELDRLRARLLEQARQQAQAQYDERVKAAEKEAEHIAAEAREKVRALEQHYLSIKDELEQAVFQRIFLETGEEKQET
jgi:vacuolar-type H+-ATPase subunit H